MKYLAKDFNVSLRIVPKVKEPERRKGEVPVAINSQTNLN